MKQAVLQQFLDASLLSVAEDDEKYKHLQKTSTDIAQKLSRRRSDVVALTLSALNPSIEPNDPILQEVETALKKQWATVRNKFPDLPGQILRAILLDALYTASRSDIHIATIVWLTGISYLPHFALGREREIWQATLRELGEAVEQRAIVDWSMPTLSNISLPELKLDMPEVELPELDVALLTTHLKAAAGPHDANGQANAPDPNPQWPNSNPAWADHFGRRAASGIAEVVDAATGEIQTYFSTIQEQVKAAVTAYLEAVRVALGEIASQGAINAQEHRTWLLWWKETCYSPSLKQSYREMDPALAMLMLAYDLHQKMPVFCPQSVEFFLRETVRSLLFTSPVDSRSIPLLEFCKTVSDKASEANIPLFPRNQPTSEGRGLFVSLVQRALQGRTVTGEDVQQRLGLDGQTQVPLDELAVWLFRDLQVQRVIAAK